ncbi:hypothetical protein NQZ68_002727 [Dissostichus eleginoides]|nr:hypothetical protein NQZ68_002727 [Dissostichus eleginoides]
MAAPHVHLWPKEAVSNEEAIGPQKHLAGDSAFISTMGYRHTSSTCETETEEDIPCMCRPQQLPNNQIHTATMRLRSQARENRPAIMMRAGMPYFCKKLASCLRVAPQEEEGKTDKASESLRWIDVPKALDGDLADVPSATKHANPLKSQDSQKHRRRKIKAIQHDDNEQRNYNEKS